MSFFQGPTVSDFNGASFASFDGASTFKVRARYSTCQGHDRVANGVLLVTDAVRAADRLVYLAGVLGDAHADQPPHPARRQLRLRVQGYTGDEQRHSCLVRHSGRLPGYATFVRCRKRGVFLPADWFVACPRRHTAFVRVSLRLERHRWLRMLRKLFGVGVMLKDAYDLFSNQVFHLYQHLWSLILVC